MRTADRGGSHAIRRAWYPCACAAAEAGSRSARDPARRLVALYACPVILVIDNYDSFTWNLVQAVGTLHPGADVRVVRNDRIDGAAAEALSPSHIIVSPGPCTPQEAGASVEVIRRLAGRVPILGVCLGHQCIAAAFGMMVRPCERPMHGMTSAVHHDGRGIFAGVASPLPAARYHSLVVEERSVPRGWEVSAWTEDPDGGRVVMGLRRARSDPDGAAQGPGARAAPLDGVQFHPESFLTPAGPRLLANFLGVGGVAAADAAPAGRSTLRA
jgi:anthranilate synthase/aminodeoxychorismate synthase-like glutamine amidotransferase